MARPSTAAHHALPDGFADTLSNMALRADALAGQATLTRREQAIPKDLARQLRVMALFPDPPPPCLR